MNSISIKDIFLVNVAFDVQSPYFSDKKLYLDVKRSFSDRFSDDNTFCGVFFDFICLLSGKDLNNKPEENLKCTLTYFISVEVADFHDEEKCRKKIIKTLAPIIETQTNNDLNYLLLKAKYPPLTINDTSGPAQQDPA